MDEIYRSQFRLPYSLYEQLKAAADENHRSVNAELVVRLEESFASETHRILRAIEPVTKGPLQELEILQLNLEIILEQVKGLAAAKKE